MTLGELIEFLEKRDPSKVVSFGFWSPHSYRGYYEQLAFEPITDTTVGEMLKAARMALGSTFSGWKGGEYTMHDCTECWIANAGNCGEPLGRALMRFICDEEPQPEDFER